MSRILPALTLSFLSAGMASAEQVDLTLTAVDIGVAATGAPAVDVHFDIESAGLLGKFTSDRVGQQVYFYSGDQLLIAPIIEVPIQSNTAQLTGVGAMDTASTTALAERLRQAGFVTLSDAPLP